LIFNWQLYSTKNQLRNENRSFHHKLSGSVQYFVIRSLYLVGINFVTSFTHPIFCTLMIYFSDEPHNQKIQGVDIGTMGRLGTLLPCMMPRIRQIFKHVVWWQFNPLPVWNSHVVLSRLSWDVRGPRVVLKFLCLL